MVRLETVDYWTRAIEDYDPRVSKWASTKTHGHGKSLFEEWLWARYRCRLTFEGAKTSAFFEFEDEKDATLFMLKYGGHESI